MMKLFRLIPLMGVVLLLFNIFSLGYDAPSGSYWEQEWLSISLPSQEVLHLTYSEGFLSFALVILFLELVKSTTATDSAVTELILSFLVLIAFLIQMLTSPHAAEPTFFILLLMSLVEALTSTVILVKVARRDIKIGS